MSSVSDLPALARTAPDNPARAALTDVAPLAWDRLAAAAIEPNAFFASGYSLSAYRFCDKSAVPRALMSYAGRSLIGLVPVVSAWQAMRLPVPAVIAHQPYSPLTVPLLHRDHADDAVAGLIAAADAAGARVVSLPSMTLEGPAYDAILRVAATQGLTPVIHNRHERAALDATQDAETYLRAGFGAKRLKELRRLRHRLDDEGQVAFSLFTEPAAVAAGVERFLALETAGWKGKGGTSLGQSEGDAAFVRAAAAALSAAGEFEVAELTLDGRLLASGLVMKQGDRAFFFKIAYDEAMARCSPGVQLTLELTRLFAADPSIALVDSTADAGHPMIDYIWRERLPVGDLLIPTRPKDALASATIGLMGARRSLRARAKDLFHRLKPIKETRT